MFTLTIAIVSCSTENDTVVDSEASQYDGSAHFKGGVTTIDYASAKQYAITYSNTLIDLYYDLDKQTFNSNQEKIDYSFNYLNSKLSVTNANVMSALNQNETFVLTEYNPNDPIKVSDIQSLTLSQIEKDYLVDLYNYANNEDVVGLISLTDDYIADLNTNPELNSLSMYFAFIDVNRTALTQSSNKVSSDCLTQAAYGGAVSGGVGMVSGAIKGGFWGSVLGLNPGTGAVGAIVGGIAGGITGFVSGAVQSYIICEATS